MPEAGEETEFGACLGGFEQYLDYTDRHFDGETARAFSDNFELVGDDAEGTVGETGYAGAVVLTADESAVGVLDAFVEQLGAGETAACIAQLESFAIGGRDESRSRCATPTKPISASATPAPASTSAWR